MAPPPSTTVKPAFGLQSETKEQVKKKGRGKVALAPGCSALDWARLTQSGKDLKGTGVGFIRVSMEELKRVGRTCRLKGTRKLTGSITLGTMLGPPSMAKSII